MKGLHEIVEAIQWHEGMLLAPHHFQQQALRQEQLLYYAMHSIAPFCWGVLHWEINQTQWSDGNFCISELQAIMPDGLMVAHNEKTGEDLSLNLKPHIEDIKYQEMLVYLRVPLYTSESLEGEQRYQSVEGKPVKSVNSDEGEISIPRLKPQMSLSLHKISEKPPHNRFTFFPIAKVTYKNGTFEQTDFIPPTLRVSFRSELDNLVSGIIALAREKAKFLSEQLRSSTAIQMNQPMSFNTQNILQGLGTSLPQLEAMLSIGKSHPYPLYLGLCALAGSVATFTSSMVPPVFNKYDHDDLRASFTPVYEFIKKILDQIHESYLALPFDKKNLHNTLHIDAELQWLTETNYFVLKIEPQHLLMDKDESYLVIGLKNPEEHSKTADLIKWGETCIIGSSTQINSLHRRRIYGATRTHIGKQEEQLNLTAQADIELFRVTVEKESIEIGEILIFVNELKEMLCPADMLLYTKPQKR